MRAAAFTHVRSKGRPPRRKESVPRKLQLAVRVFAAQVGAANLALKAVASSGGKPRNEASREALRQAGAMVTLVAEAAVSLSGLLQVLAGKNCGPPQKGRPVPEMPDKRVQPEQRVLPAPGEGSARTKNRRMRRRQLKLSRAGGTDHRQVGGATVGAERRDGAPRRRDPATSSPVGPGRSGDLGELNPRRSGLMAGFFPCRAAQGD